MPTVVLRQQVNRGNGSPEPPLGSAWLGPSDTTLSEMGQTPKAIELRFFMFPFILDAKGDRGGNTRDTGFAGDTVDSDRTQKQC